jgi:NNP family nitrate/nitrite transporter-like MFS transporter
MALVYWLFTSDSPHKQHHGESIREIVGVYRSGVVVWLVAYLYWVSFGTLTFFASAVPTYLLDRWHVDPTRASMVYTPLLVVCVAITRPLGGWLADQFDPLKILGRLFGIMAILALVMAMQISLNVELFAIYGLALLAGAAAAAVIKLIPVSFRHVGAVSGLAKAAGAACGFTMTITLAASKDLLGSYTLGFAIWALMNIAAFYIAVSRFGFTRSYIEAVPSAAATAAMSAYSKIASPNSARSTLKAQ